MRTFTDEAADFISALPTVQAGRAKALIHVIFTVFTIKTWHADTGVFPNLVQAGGIILARVGQTLIDVLLTARPCISRGAVTGE